MESRETQAMGCAESCVCVEGEMLLPQKEDRGNQSPVVILRRFLIWKASERKNQVKHKNEENSKYIDVTTFLTLTLASTLSLSFFFAYALLNPFFLLHFLL